jgi:hypothetical protein
VRSVVFRLLVALVVLTASPLLGWGGSARADYIAPLTPANPLNATATIWTFAGLVSESDNQRAEERSAPRKSPTIDPNADAAPSGAGSQSSSGPGPRGPNQAPVPASAPQADALVLIGAIFLERVLRQPCPFPFPPFRPPRLAEIRAL